MVFRNIGTLTSHALMDDTIEQASAVVAEGGAVVRLYLELVLRPRVLRFILAIPLISQFLMTFHTYVHTHDLHHSNLQALFYPSRGREGCLFSHAF